MASIEKIKKDVRNFYDQVGWKQISDGVYQNAQYEDLRPVSREYIHRCHLRINRYINISGKYLLDAGSGPIQYPEYLTYSQGYEFRVCVDISIVALQEAQTRIKDHGFCVVADIARLPFQSEVFEGIVSLHTIHHLPPEDYFPAYSELKRVLSKDSKAVVVNGWDESSLMRIFKYPILVMEKITGLFKESSQPEQITVRKSEKPEGTYVHKLNAKKLKILLGENFPIRIHVWRSVSVRFLRALIHPWFFGKIKLKILFYLEEKFPEFFGEKGQYPLIIFEK